MTVYEHTQQFHVKDPFSALTHFIGFILSIAALAVLLVKGGADKMPLINLIGVSVFAISSILLYGASTTYHTFDVRQPFEKALKKVDHLSIFVLIAGTYTPYALLAFIGIKNMIIPIKEKIYILTFLKKSFDEELLLRQLFFVFSIISPLFYLLHLSLTFLYN